MRYILRAAIFVSIGVSAMAAEGMFWRFLGYSLGEAFGQVLKAPEDPIVRQQVAVWTIYFLASIAITTWLFLTYRKSKRALWDKDRPGESSSGSAQYR